MVLIHGAATTSRIWDGVLAELGNLLPDSAVVAVDRACSGSLDSEIEALGPLCDGAAVVGVSGGATLGLELASRGVPFRVAILHEPAVGSLLPGLLAPIAAAYQAEGVPGFARALYGPLWSPTDAPTDPEAVGRDLAMFRAFEPATPSPGSGPVLITVGELSPAIRYDAAQALRREFGYPVQVLPGCGHAAHLQAPHQLAELIAATARS